VDIARPDGLKRKRTRQIGYGVSTILIVLAMGVGVARLKPAAPGIERATLWIDTVQRGAMVRQVRGTGTLVPEDLRWIPAATSGRVERIIIQPGSVVGAATVILELSNPALEQEFQDAQLKVKSAEAGLANLRVQLETEQLQREAATSIIEADYRKAALQAQINQQLAGKQLVSTLTLQQSQLDERLLASRYDIAKKQLEKGTESMRARVASEESTVDQVRALMRLKRRQVDELHVRAVSIDTRNGLVGGRVARIAPSVQNGTVTVDVMLEGALPKGSRPDLTVDGTIELERLSDVLFVGRPALGQEQSSVSVFKLEADGTASRIQVKVGRMSVDRVELLTGLSAGDQVVLSDMSAWDAYDRVRLQ
jgi:HlyD family secretion protein